MSDFPQVPNQPNPLPQGFFIHGNFRPVGDATAEFGDRHGQVIFYDAQGHPLDGADILYANGASPAKWLKADGTGGMEDVPASAKAAAAPDGSTKALAFPRGPGILHPRYWANSWFDKPGMTTFCFVQNGRKYKSSTPTAGQKDANTLIAGDENILSAMIQIIGLPDDADGKRLPIVRTATGAPTKGKTISNTGALTAFTSAVA